MEEEYKVSKKPAQKKLKMQNVRKNFKDRFLVAPDSQHWEFQKMAYLM